MVLHDPIQVFQDHCTAMRLLDLLVEEHSHVVEDNKLIVADIIITKLATPAVSRLLYWLVRQEFSNFTAAKNLQESKEMSKL